MVQEMSFNVVFFLFLALVNHSLHCAILKENIMGNI